MSRSQEIRLTVTTWHLLAQDFGGPAFFSHHAFLLASHSLVLIAPQMPGIPPMPPMPMPPMPPGMGMLQAMSMMSGGPPPPGMHMGMEPPPGIPPPSISQEEQLKMAQQRAALMLQQEERAKHQVRTFIHYILYSVTFQMLSFIFNAQKEAEQKVVLRCSGQSKSRQKRCTQSANVELKKKKQQS